ncbi:MAG: hypothetical protein HY298_21390 [Verrucomicrobia bacterium]|nr:hypothetical protein [Verrucomicrobiota bacterium]
MKKLAVILVASLCCVPAGLAQIAKWTFEASVPTNSGPYLAEVGTGTASGFHVGVGTNVAVYSNPSGNGSVESYSANVWSVGDYWQFQTSTLGFTGIAVSYDQTGSSTGPRDFSLQYSTDGVLFTQFGLSYTVLLNGAPNPVWNSTTSSGLFTFAYDLSSVTALDNAPVVYFRIIDGSTTSIGGGTVATAGTDRIDNFTVSVVPEPQDLFLFGGLGLLAWTALRRRPRWNRSPSR